MIKIGKMENNIKSIAIYLPQYHTIKENNEWWGDGFTEWTNVKNAKPLFKGHYQPHIPENNNYYDLGVFKEMVSQGDLAKQYGIYGFCFYHYWFNGKLLLEKPLHDMLELGKPNMPFCLSWANENWTRSWDGLEKQVLVKQEYSLEDDLEHIKYLIPFFKDDRYIKVDNKPVFLMYRSELHPNIMEGTKIWRDEAKKAGFEDLYLIRMENFKRNIDPALHGFDAGMEFAPDSTLTGKKIAKSNMVKYLFHKLLHQLNLRKSSIFENSIFSYPLMANKMINKPDVDYKYFRCVCPSWDNSARRTKNATMYVGSTPELFKNWVQKMINHTTMKLDPKEQFLFINAWNEWAEGCHLEPDLKNGYSYLKSFKQALDDNK